MEGIKKIMSFFLDGDGTTPPFATPIQFPGKDTVKFAFDTGDQGTSTGLYVLLLYYSGTTLPSKRNATLGSEAPVTPILGQRPHRGKKLLTGIVSPIASHRSNLNSLWFWNAGQNAESLLGKNLALNPKIPLTPVLLGGIF